MDRTITLIRHGCTPGNREKRYVGIIDETLDLESELDIKARAYPKADIVFSSPMIRCIQTAKIIYPDQEPIVIHELRETDFGRFEGKNYQELSGDKEYQSWIESNGEAPFPGGESRSQASSRALKGFEKLLAQSQDYENISVVAHGGTIMAILSNIFGGDYYSYHVENGEGYTFDLSYDGLYSGLCTRSFNR
ncbi:histidine phosphatase family protein [Pseudobutyrivibrio ruminis]|uniref:histidine phosphatase family protein n=1 Tax=Pseudobutyrivibrio ruminis TaxID=46206 RepID=UPI0026EFAB5B|nr:histidine phosphatase family protein [Pseudobutyrivibrio ruminis]